MRFKLALHHPMAAAHFLATAVEHPTAIADRERRVGVLLRESTIVAAQPAAATGCGGNFPV